MGTCNFSHNHKLYAITNDTLEGLNGKDVAESISLNPCLEGVLTTKKQHSYATGGQRIQPIIRARSSQKIIQEIEKAIKAILQYPPFQNMDIQRVDIFLNRVDLQDVEAKVVSRSQYSV